MKLLGNLLEKLVHEVVWQARQCMKLLGNLTVCRVVVD